jgi:hypothetical protein
MTKAVDAPLTTEIISMIRELDSLISKNDLKAKNKSKKFSKKLQSTMFQAEAVALETQISQFDFEKARKTFQELKIKILQQAQG